MNTREYWTETLVRIARPVYAALADDRLRAEMPVENTGAPDGRVPYAHLEALGRSLAGIGPWLDSPLSSPSEEHKKRELQQLVRASLDHATNPKSKDYMNFSEGIQPLVDSAFLAQGLLRSWDSVWSKLKQRVQHQIIEALLVTRRIKPGHNNWLLFSAMIETFLWRAGRDWDRMRIDYALTQHQQWYKGDGAYGDGPEFHWDYYNSYVIQPMLYDIVTAGGEISEQWSPLRDPVLRRIKRYACVQEKLISPEGTFPALGRSIAYRFGAFQSLALVALKSEWSNGLSPAATRCALTAVIRRMVDRDDVFDNKGWLKIGFCGHQPSMGEWYICTGSLYLCLCGLLPLGLSESDPFWSAPDADWSSKRIWNGEDTAVDAAIQG